MIELRDERVVERTFTVVRRGFDPEEVRRHLVSVAREIERLRQREQELTLRVTELEAQSASTAAPTGAPTAAAEPDIDEATVLRLLGEEATRVLTAARDAAAEIRAKAEDGMASMLRDAQADAAKVRSEAEIEAARIRRAAQTDVDAQIAAAKDEGRQMVAEAQAVRERMLGDLAKRRHSAREQLLLMKESRDRLLEAFDGVRTTLLDVNSLLRAAAPEPPIDLAPIAALEAMAPPADVRHDLDALVDALPSTSVDTEPDADESAPEPVNIFEPTPAKGLPVLEQLPQSDAVIIDLKERSAASAPVAAGESARATVDDLFARIRASNVETVARHAAVVSLQEAPEGMDAATADQTAATDEPDAPDAPDDRPVELAVRDRALDPVIAKLGRKLKRALADEQNEAFDHLRRVQKLTDVGQLLGDADIHAARYHDAAREALREAIMAGGADPDALIGGLIEEVDRQIAVPLRERIVEVTQSAGGDPHDISDVLRSAYREWKVQRLDEIGVELAVTAYERASYETLPAGSAICWMVDPRERPCADADDNVLAGSIAKGEPFPTGHLCAPAHPGCRCHVAPAPQ